MDTGIRFDPIEIQFILRHYHNMSYAEIGREIGRSSASVGNFLQKQGLTRPNRYKSLRSADVRFIEKNLDLNDSELAREIGCSSMTISIYRKKLSA